MICPAISRYIQAKKNKGMNRKLDSLKRQNSKAVQRYIEDEQEPEVEIGGFRYESLHDIYYSVDKFLK
jgi:hypothetical protein